MSTLGTLTDGHTGLTDAEAARRAAAGDSNAYVPDTSRSVWHIIRANVFTLFNGIVFGCFFVLFLVGRWQDALFGFAAFANAIIGCVQEFRAKAALDRLALLNAPRARVLRSGAEKEVSPDDVVRDDLLVLRAGDQVAADAVVVEERGLQIDESMLTGESDPVDKARDADALSGSVVVGGEGLARVTRVGAESYAHRFAGEARRFSLVASELRTSINRVLRWVAWGIGPIGLLLFNAQVLVTGGYRAVFTAGNWVQAVVNTIASITAMIPLGLVLMTSIAFAVGAAKLARRQVLVNELPAVEGLARVDVICLDKTGTLTVGDIVFDAARDVGDVDGWEEVLGWFAAAPDANATARALRDTYPASGAVDDAAYIPFSSARKWSAVSRPAWGTWVMGAPEMVFPRDGGGAALRSMTAELARGGRRTLVLAHTGALLDPESDAEALPGGLAPVVVLTFREQVRADAADTLRYFGQQGVGIRIVSGDNPSTVAAIARDVGLDAGEGFDARNLPDADEDVADVLEQHIVFGRVTPEQKKRIVIALQSRGHTVAMTGDGVNDALAIKTADIGIAMNSGSAATKAVARLVLLDGQFSHLPDVVAEGRQVIANIERVSMLFLTKTVYATTLAVLFGLLILEYPFLPRQLSITDGLTIGIPAFFLALMPNVQRYVPGFLRRSLSFAIPAGLIVGLGLTFYALWATVEDAPEAQIRTGATIILAVVGIWILAVLARPLNRYKVLVVGGMFVGLLAIFTMPITVAFFELVDPGLELVTRVVLVAIVMIALIEIVRWVRAMALADPHRPVNEPIAAGTPAGRVLVTVVSLILTVFGLAAAGLGLLVLLDRYDTTSPEEVLVTSLVGAGIALFGLLLVAVAGGLRRGSRFSRWLVTGYLGILAALNLAVTVIDRDWTWSSTGSTVLAIAFIVVLWVRPAAGVFRDGE